MGRVFMSGVVPTLTTPSTIPANFADATWEQIIEACETNTVPDTWVVGDQKAMNINGAYHIIDIIGKNHDEYSDGSGYAPLTFQFHVAAFSGVKFYTTATNVGGWTDCIARNTRLPAIFQTLPTKIQNGIKNVNKLTSAGNNSSVIATTSDALFLLSEIEMFGVSNVSFAGEGFQYEYYASGNSTVKAQNYISDNATLHYTRSPSMDNVNFVIVNSTGGATTMNAHNASYGAPAFCF